MGLAGPVGAANLFHLTSVAVGLTLGFSVTFPPESTKWMMVSRSVSGGVILPFSIQAERLFRYGQCLLGILL